MRQVVYIFIATLLLLTSCSKSGEVEITRSEFTADISISNITATTADFKCSLSSQAQPFIFEIRRSELITESDDEALMSSIISTLQSDNSIYSNVMQGDFEGQYTGLEPATSYTTLLFAVNSTLDSAISTLTRVEFTTESVEMSDQAAAWLGRWELTSTSSYIAGSPLTIEIEIRESATSDLKIYGLDISYERWTYALPVNLTDEGGWVATDCISLETIPNGEICYSAITSLGAPYDRIGFVAQYFEEDYYPLSASPIEDDCSIVTPGSGSLDDSFATPFTVWSMVLSPIYSDSAGLKYYYYLGGDESLGFDSSEILIAPFTLRRISSL